MKNTKSKGHLSVSNDDAVSTHAEATNLFGSVYKLWLPAWWNVNSHYAVWFPCFCPHKEWENSLSSDGTVISEKKVDRTEHGPHKPEDVIHIVFGKYKGKRGKVSYKYVGEFIYDKEASNEYERIYKRIKDKTDISEVLNS